MLRLLAFYTALFLGVNIAAAGAVDWDALAEDGLTKIAPTEPVKPVPDIAFTDRDGNEKQLSDWEGQVLLVNFWATWCVPCREEMPALDNLQAALGGDDFAVLTIASGRNAIEGIDKFFAENGIEGLPVLRDERQALSRKMGVLGLPVSVLIDREGNEIARVIGDLEWDSDVAKDLISQMIAL